MKKQRLSWGRLITFVKTHRSIYIFYYGLMTLFVNLLKCFIIPEDELFLFVVYGGKSFADSPRCLYEAMKVDERFKRKKLVWAFRHPELFPHVPDKIKIDTFRYYVTALKARCWITNESITRALKFKGRKTFYFSTTHTALPKHGGVDLKSGATFTPISDTKYDCTCAQSEAEKSIQIRKYGLKEDQVIVCGYPKNDKIANHTEDEVKRIKEKLNINNHRKLILYAPTFRERGLAPLHLNMALWKNYLSKDYILLYRVHHSMLQETNMVDCEDFVIDVSKYPDNTELLIASDILISDYSGIFFEFGVQNKPMYCFAYDYDDYVNQRGLYVNLATELPGGKMSEQEFLDYFVNTSIDDINQKVKCFRDKYITEYGNATARCLNIIDEHTH